MAERKILAVDDDEEILGLIARALGDRNFQVTKISRGSDVVEKAKMLAPDVILMDILMEDMDGAAVVRQLQNEEETRGIPVIFLSGIVVGDDSASVPTVTVGERKYPAIAKPFSVETLVAKIEEYV